jgi:hypothetical protein
MPETFGPWHTISTCFKHSSETGLFWGLAYQLQQAKKLTVDISWVDSMTIPIHRHGSGALKKGNPSIGRGGEGVGTKIHWDLSTTNVQSIYLSGAQETDMKTFTRLWQLGDWRKINHVLPDKGYDFSAVRTPSRKAG